VTRLCQLRGHILPLVKGEGSHQGWITTCWLLLIRQTLPWDGRRGAIGSLLLFLLFFLFLVLFLL
jgi:hypothetical protein